MYLYSLQYSSGREMGVEWTSEQSEEINAGRRREENKSTTAIRRE